MSHNSEEFYTVDDEAFAPAVQPTYNEAFPPLEQRSDSPGAFSFDQGQWNKKLSLKSSTTTQVITNLNIWAVGAVSETEVIWEQILAFCGAKNASGGSFIHLGTCILDTMDVVHPIRCNYTPGPLKGRRHFVLGRCLRRRRIPGLSFTTGKKVSKSGPLIFFPIVE
jgi:hypothetical protein